MDGRPSLPERLGPKRLASWRRLVGLAVAEADPPQGFLVFYGEIAVCCEFWDLVGPVADRLLELWPSSADGWYLRGASLECEGRCREACPALAIATRLAPAHHRAWAILAGAQHQVGDQRAALEAIEEALRLAPKLPLYWQLLANIQVQLGNQTRALVAAERLIALAPDYRPGHVLREKALAALNGLGPGAAGRPEATP